MENASTTAATGSNNASNIKTIKNAKISGVQHLTNKKGGAYVKCKVEYVNSAGAAKVITMTAHGKAATNNAEALVDGNVTSLSGTYEQIGNGGIFFDLAWAGARPAKKAA